MWDYLDMSKHAGQLNERKAYQKSLPLKKIEIPCVKLKKKKKE